MKGIATLLVILLTGAALTAAQTSQTPQYKTDKSFSERLDTDDWAVSETPGWPITANQLLTETNRDDCSARGFVSGFVAGVAELGQMQGTLCFPDGTKREALLGTVKRYMETHPDKLDWLATMLVHSALAEQWGCKALGAE